MPTIFKLSLSLLVLLIYGCVPKAYYQNPHKSVQEQNSDLSYCSEQASMSTLGNTMLFSANRDNCLYGIGYHKTSLAQFQVYKVTFPQKTDSPF